VGNFDITHTTAVWLSTARKKEFESAVGAVRVRVRDRVSI